MTALEASLLKIGLILAGEALGAIALAALVRLISTHKIHGQTYWMVVVGVAGTVVIAGPQIGWENVGFLAACFAVSGLIMGVEYFTRLTAEHKAAQAIQEQGK